MEYDISIDHENNIVWAQCRGSMDMTEAVPMTEEVRAQALELGYHAIYDMTEASPRISLSKAYAFQRNIKDLYADPTHRYGKAALLCAPGKDEMFWRFLETTAQNNGILIKLFLDRTESVKWLTDDTAD